VSGEILVGVAPGANGIALQQMLKMAVGTVLDVQRPIGVCRVRLRSGLNTDLVLQALRKVQGVAFVERNAIESEVAVPNDPSYSYQYNLQRVGAERAWSAWRPVTPVIVAVVDSGIDSTHPDLANKILRDAGGIVGYDAFMRARSEAKDDRGHGTHCAGIVAAQINNGIGVAGVAGWDGNPATSDFSYVKLMPVKVLDHRGTGTTAALAEGITWAADNGADVISLSVGSTVWSETRSSAVRYALQKGCVVVAAAGNSGSDTVFYPAGEPGVLSVGATDFQDQLTYFSQYGPWVKIAAPGDQIYSTTPTIRVSGARWTHYAFSSGTSMACPHVAGAAALLLAQHPGLTATQVVDLLVRNTDPYTPYESHTLATTAGRLNLDRALQAASFGGGRRPAPGPSPAPSPAPAPAPSPAPAPAPSPLPDLSGLTVTPGNVTSGATATLQIRLDGRAPAEGATIALSSDSPAASLPQSVLIPSGAREASVTVHTHSVRASTPVLLSASYRGVTRRADLMVGTLRLSSLRLTSGLLSSGRPVNAVVTLEGPAPAGGVEVQLASSRPDFATVPPTVVVPEGSTSATFPLTRQVMEGPSRVATVAIRASAGGVTRAASLYVRSP
jgi:thermitase